MRSNRMLFAAALGVAMIAAVAGIPSAASASTAATSSVVAPAAALPYEWDTAVEGSPPEDRECTEMTGAVACFEKYGDKWWVYDSKADGHSATASWFNDLIDHDGVVNFYRQGSCVNKLGAGHWGVCNKNYYETTDDMDSWLGYQACVYDPTTGDWYGCNAGVNDLNNA